MTIIGTYRHYVAKFKASETLLDGHLLCGLANDPAYFHSTNYEQFERCFSQCTDNYTFHASIRLPK